MNPDYYQPPERLSFAEWWRDEVAYEIDATAPKMREYGSNDLVEIGRTMAGADGREVTDDQAYEMGAYFYLIGKMARWTNAVNHGREVSDDTLRDIAVYTKMVQYRRVNPNLIEDTP